MSRTQPPMPPRIARTQPRRSERCSVWLTAAPPPPSLLLRYDTAVHLANIASRAATQPQQKQDKYIKSRLRILKATLTHIIATHHIAILTNNILYTPASSQPCQATHPKQPQCKQARKQAKHASNKKMKCIMYNTAIRTNWLAGQCKQHTIRS